MQLVVACPGSLAWALTISLGRSSVFLCEESVLVNEINARGQAHAHEGQVLEVLCSLCDEPRLEPSPTW